MLVERPLWTLYAGGVLWVRNSAQKGSVKSVCSVREKVPQHVRKTSPTWEKKLPNVWERCDKKGEHICLMVIWVILYPYEKHLQNAAKWPFIYDGNIGKKVEYNQHVSRGLWALSEERLFLHQEGAFLVSRRACSRMLKGMFLSVERRGQDRRGAKIVYRFGVMDWCQEDRGVSYSCSEGEEERVGTTCIAGDA